MNKPLVPYFNPPNNPIYLEVRIKLAREAQFHNSGVVIKVDSKIVTLKGEEIEAHIRQLKKELAALTQ
jgi:hypothetical protein